MLKQITSSIVVAVIVLVAASVVLVGTTCGQVAARTTIALDTPQAFGPPFNYTVDSVVIDWCTSETTGVISESQLIGLTFSLRQGATTVYIDEAIINSAVQPIGGVGRVIADLEFIFDLDNLADGLVEYDNDRGPVQAGAAAGETFNLFGDSNDSNFTAFSNGNFVANTEIANTHNTVALPVKDIFGSGVNAFKIDFVTIGDPGNAPDTTGNPNPAGSVACTYSMGKFEVSREMITKANAEGGLGITLADMTSFGGNGVDRPATGVSWNEAGRFVNWLNTSTGGFAAYKFPLQPGDAGYSANFDIQLWTPADTLDYDAANPFRSKRATYVLPSMDEWYKAAYYNPGTGMYGDYPSSDGTLPTAVASGTADKTAVFSQSSATGPADITQAGGLSAYGIMGLGGNVYEWEETAFDLLNSSGSSDRGLRGGSWSVPSSTLSASDRLSGVPAFGEFSVGFRVVRLVQLGDANGDGVVDFVDVTPFLQALFDRPGYEADFPGIDPDIVLDINCDGVQDFVDVTPFLDILFGP